MKNINEQIGSRIKELRLRASLTQESLSHSAGIHVTFLSEIERGIKKPSIESLEKILTALNTSFQDFFNFEISVNDFGAKSILNKLINKLRSRSEQEIKLVYEIANKIIEYGDKGL